MNLHAGLSSEGSPSDLNDDADGLDRRAHLNPESLNTITGYVEPELLKAAPGYRVQFERVGYFCADANDSLSGAPVFNRTIALKDSFAKELAKG